MRSPVVRVADLFFGKDVSQFEETILWINELVRRVEAVVHQFLRVDAGDLWPWKRGG